MMNVIKVASAFLFVSAGLFACKSNQNGKSSSGDSITSHQHDNEKASLDTLKEFNNQDWLLIPGSSAGKIALNQDVEEVYKRLGKADGGDAAMQKSIAIWYNNHDSTQHSVAIYTARDTGNDPKALIKQIRINSPRFNTKEGIHTTSPLDSIKKVFQVQKTEEYEDAGKNYTVYDSKSGISFEMDGKDECAAIIIHKSGEVGIGTYLKFRTTNKFISR